MGKDSKRNKVHNARLMREVKTISRMTHKNIVRYYQAWVEGSSPSIDESNLAPKNQNRSASAIPLDDSQSSDDASKSGWWQKSPLLGPKKEDGIIDLDDNFNRLDNTLADGSGGDDDTSLSWSKSSSASFESSYGSVLYQFQNPILTGFNFQDTYDNMFQKSVEGGEHLSDTHSAHERITGSSQHSILYIQMEYCATTLRHLIDDGSITRMGQNEIWRLLRQITVRSDLVDMHLCKSHCTYSIQIYIFL